MDDRWPVSTWGLLGEEREVRAVYGDDGGRSSAAEEDDDDDADDDEKEDDEAEY